MGPAARVTSPGARVLLGAGCALVVALSGAAFKSEPLALAQGAPPTFNREVAPILYKHCSGCHRPDGIAPMSLLTHAETSAWADGIKAMVGSREMPPWYADPAFGDFKNARGLTTAEIGILGAWADGGAPEGTGTSPRQPTFRDSGWDSRMNRPPDDVLELPFDEFELPASGEVPTFTVWTKLPTRGDKWVQAIQIKPSLRNVVHHSSLALATLPAGTTIGRAPVFQGGPTLDGVPVYGDGRPFRAASGDEFGRPVLFYVPGGGFMQLQDGLAKRFGQNDYLAWGLHLISAGRVETLRVQIGIWYARREPHHEVHTWTVNQRLLVNDQEVRPDAAGARVVPDIPPGVSNWAVTGTLAIDEDITLYSLWPHMHYRGKDMTFVLTDPKGAQTTLLAVPRYNPHWQLTYELAKPLRVRRGSTITAFGHFDNSSANHHNPDPSVPVRFGPQGTDEMYIPFIELSVDRDDLRFERLLGR